MRLFEIVVVSVLSEMLMPAQFGPRKSKTLLFVMTLFLLLKPAEPRDVTQLMGKLAPAGPMLLFEMMLPLFVVPVEVLIKTLPPPVVETVIDEPRIVQLVIVLFCAP